MKIRIVGLAMLAVASGPGANQPAADGGFPAVVTKSAGPKHPQVNPATLRALPHCRPRAQNVRVSLWLGGRGGTALAKAEDGAWSARPKGPMDEGFIITTTVDGGTFNDPAP